MTASTEVNQERLNEQIKATKKTIVRLWEQRESNEIPLNENIRKIASQVEETGCPKQFISSEIIRMFSANNRLQRYIADVLDSSYKNKYTKQQIVQGRTDSIEECSINAESIKETLEKAKYLSPEDLGRGEFQDIAQLVYETKNKYEDRAEEYEIPLSYVRTNLDDEEEDKKEQEPATLSEDETVRKLQKILASNEREIGDAHHDIADDIEKSNYVAEDKEVLEQYILGQNAYLEMLKPKTDRKWGLDLLEWCGVIEKFYDQGGTYASSKSAVDVADMVNPKTGKPIQRKITKEQIDAVHPKLLNNMRFIISNFKYFLALYKNYQGKERGYRAKRRVVLHDTLSEAA